MKPRINYRLADRIQEYLETLDPGILEELQDYRAAHPEVFDVALRYCGQEARTVFNVDCPACGRARNLEDGLYVCDNKTCRDLGIYRLPV